MATTETKVSSIKGATAPEFDGVSLPTLRAWLKYWSDEKRSAKDPAITEERPRATHISLIEKEIAAREAAKKA
jgi:transposase-like protein